MVVSHGELEEMVIVEEMAENVNVDIRKHVEWWKITRRDVRGTVVSVVRPQTCRSGVLMEAEREQHLKPPSVIFQRRSKFWRNFQRERIVTTRLRAPLSPGEAIIMYYARRTKCSNHSMLRYNVIR